MDARRGTHILQFSRTMGTALLRLTIPDFSLRDVRSTKIMATIIDGRTKGPRSLERRSRTGCTLSRDGVRKEGGDDYDCGERTHFLLGPVASSRGNEARRELRIKLIRHRRSTWGASRTCVSGRRIQVLGSPDGWTLGGWMEVGDLRHASASTCSEISASQ